MARKTRSNSSSHLRYFYLNGDLHRVLRQSRADDQVIAWNFPLGKRVAYSLVDVMRNKQHAYQLRHVCELLGKHQDTIKARLYDGTIRTPQRSYSIDERRSLGKYYWSEDNVRELYDFFRTVHIGRPRKDGTIVTSQRLPSRAELEAKMRQETVLYVRNDEGEFVPVWKQPVW